MEIQTGWAITLSRTKRTSARTTTLGSDYAIGGLPGRIRNGQSSKTKMLPAPDDVRSTLDYTEWSELYPAL